MRVCLFISNSIALGFTPDTFGLDTEHQKMIMQELPVFTPDLFGHARAKNNGMFKLQTLPAFTQPDAFGHDTERPV